MANIRDYVLECAKAGDLAPLAFQLEFTDNELTIAERAFLAQYLRGEIKKGTNRPKKSPRVRWEALSIMDVILCLEAKGSTRAYVFSEAAEICGISEATARRRIKDDLLPSDEVERRENLTRFNTACDELDAAMPGHGLKMKDARIQHILSGQAYRDARVTSKRV